jgi:glutathione S-transferase
MEKQLKVDYQAEEKSVLMMCLTQLRDLLEEKEFIIGDKASIADIAYFNELQSSLCVMNAHLNSEKIEKEHHTSEEKIIEVANFPRVHAWYNRMSSIPSITTSSVSFNAIIG